MQIKSFCLGAGLVIIGFVVAIVVIIGLFFPEKRVFTEAQINASFDRAVTNQAASNNQLTDINISLEQDRGVITGTWAQGEQLTGDIVVSTDGKSLRSQNVVVSNAGPVVKAIFENVANAVIQAGLNNAVAQQGSFKEAKIEKDQITVIYR